MTSLAVLLTPFQPVAVTASSLPDSTVCSSILPVDNWQLTQEDDITRSVSVPFILLDGRQQFTVSCDFDLPEDSSGVYILRLDGINYACNITINDHFLHSHALGYAPFQLEIPDEIIHRGAANSLLFSIDNHLDYRSTLPTQGGIRQPRNETGLPRSIDLLHKPPVYLSSVKLTQSALNRGRRQLQAVVTLRNTATAAGLAPEEEFRIVLEVPDYGSSKKKVFLHPQSTETTELTLVLKKVPLWSITEPHLFPVVITLQRRNGDIIDREEIAYGFRDITSTDGRIQLNDDPFLLRGLVYHLDGAHGQLLDKQQLRTDVELIKNIGCNTLFMQGAPAPQELLTLCDQNGLFLIDNLPIEQPTTELLSGESFVEASNAYLLALLDRDSNHPCLLAINLLTDGILGNAGTERFLLEILSKLPENAPLTTGRFAALDGIPEVLPSLIFISKDMLPLLPGSVAGDHPLLIDNIGLPAEAGNLAGFANPWSEIHQAQQLDLMLQEYADSANYAGLLLHSFTDWHGAHPMLWRTYAQDLFLHTTGIYTLDRQEKISARVVNSHFTGAPLPPLTRGDFKTTTPIWPPLVSLLLLLLLVIAMKHNGILTLNIKRSLVHVEGFYFDIQSRRIQQMGQGAFIALLNSLMLASLLAMTFHFFRKTLLFDEILTLLMPHAVIKSFFVYMSWQPLIMVMYGGLLLFLLQWLAGLFFFLLGFVFGSATSLRQMLHYFFWSSTPLLFLLPFSLIYGQLLTFPGGATISLLLFVLFAIWYLVRLNRISRFAYPANHGKVIVTLIAFTVLILLLLFLYYETGMAFTDRLQYLLMVY